MNNVPVIIRRCTNPIGELIGYMLHTHPVSDDDDYLIFANQESMPGIRVGKTFTPSFGEKLTYVDIEAEVKALRSALHEVKSAIELEDEILSIVDDALTIKESTSD